MDKKRTTKIIIAVAVVLLIIALVSGGIKKYNNLVVLEETINNKYAAIDTQLQRRADLIPNLVNTVKGYANHEETVFTTIAEARTKLLSADNAKEAAEANEVLSASITKLLAISESYPELKANEEFTGLRDELAGTENRIAVARKDYNDAAYEYNKSIKMFPNNIYANIFGFEIREYFEADKSANEVPNVSFE